MLGVAEREHAAQRRRDHELVDELPRLVGLPSRVLDGARDEAVVGGSPRRRLGVSPAEEAEVIREGAGPGVERRVAGRLCVEPHRVVGATVARGEEREEEAEVRGRGGVATMADLHVNAREVELGAGADVAEVRTGERVRAEQGGLEAVRGLQEHELHGREEGRDLPGRHPLGQGMQGPRPRGGEAEGSSAEEDAASHGRKAKRISRREKAVLWASEFRLRVATWALFSSCQKPKSFQDFPSHRILRHIHEILNIDKNKN